jgi:hypothetical protein
MRKRNTLILVATILAMLVAGIVPASMILNSGGSKAAAAPAGHFNAGKAVGTSMRAATSIDESKVPQATSAQLAAQHKTLPILGNQQKMAAAKTLAKTGPANTGTPQRSAPAAKAGSGTFTPGAQQTFNGQSDTCGCAPPDMAVAANDNYVVQAVNVSIAVYNASNGNIISGWPKTWVSFFGVPNPTGCSGATPFLSDPRLFYEPNKARFWMTALEVENAFGANPGCTFVSRYWVAVSKTSNPTGGWWVYAFDMSLGSGNAADYTQAGFDSTGFYWSGNMFNAAGTAYIGSNIFGAPKRLMESGAGLTYWHYSNPSWCNTVCVNFDTLQPALTETMNTGPRGEVFVSTWNIFGDPEGHDCNSTACSGGTALVMSNIDNANGDGPTLTGARFSGGPSVLQPPAGDSPGCPGCMETLDTRISGQPVYSAGNVYFAFETRYNNGSQNVPGVAFEEVQVGMTDNHSGCVSGDHCADIDGSSTFLLQSASQFYTGDADASFGAVMVNNNGDIIMVFEYSSGSVNPEVAYVARRATFHGGNFHDGGLILHSGAGSSSGRWGDYEAASYTGFYKDQIWIAGEWAQANGDWSTSIGRVNFTSLYQS